MLLCYSTLVTLAFLSCLNHLSIFSAAFHLLAGDDPFGRETGCLDPDLFPSRPKPKARRPALLGWVRQLDIATRAPTQPNSRHEKQHAPLGAHKHVGRTLSAHIDQSSRAPVSGNGTWLMLANLRPRRRRRQRGTCVQPCTTGAGARKGQRNQKQMRFLALPNTNS